MPRRALWVSNHFTTKSRLLGGRFGYFFFLLGEREPEARAGGGVGFLNWKSHERGGGGGREGRVSAANWQTLRAQIERIQDRPPGLKFSIEIENFKRATKQTPFFVGNSEGQDWKFQSRLKFSSEIEIFNRDWFFSIFGPLGNWGGGGAKFFFFGAEMSTKIGNDIERDSKAWMMASASTDAKCCLSTALCGLLSQPFSSVYQHSFLQAYKKKPRRGVLKRVLGDECSTVSLPWRRFQHQLRKLTLSSLISEAFPSN